AAQCSVGGRLSRWRRRRRLCIAADDARVLRQSRDDLSLGAAQIEVDHTAGFIIEAEDRLALALAHRILDRQRYFDHRAGEELLLAFEGRAGFGENFGHVCHSLSWRYISG